MNDANADLMPFDSIQSLSKANPSCWLLLKPSKENAFEIFGGKQDTNRCNVPRPRCIAETVSRSMYFVYFCPILLYSCHTTV